MRAPVLHGRRSMAFEEVPEPEPGAGEVLISVDLCGICGSDLHLYDSPLAPDGIVMGHEFGGTVVSVGPGVAGWSRGERVVATMPEPCLTCTFCRRGDFDMCYQHYRLQQQASGDSSAEAPLGSGGYAPLLTTSAARLLRIPDELDDRQAACVEPAAVGLRAVRRSGLQLGDRVAVIGGGPIGLFTLQCALAAGAVNAVMVEPASRRREAAGAAGASSLINPLEVSDTPAAIASVLAGPPDVVFDAAGVPATLQGAVDAVKPDGHVMMVGVSFEPAPVDLFSWITRRVTLRASYAYSRADYRSTIDLMIQERIDIAPVVTGVIPAAETPAAFERLLEPNDDIKVLVDPS